MVISGSMHVMREASLKVVGWRRDEVRSLGALMRLHVGMLALILATGPAEAELKDLSYTEQVILWNEQLDQAAKEFELDGSMTYTAKKTATAWVHLGPCNGSADDFPDAMAVLSIVIGATPTNPYYSSILTMIGLLSRENLGRTPPENLCKFAKDMANQ